MLAGPTSGPATGQESDPSVPRVRTPLLNTPNNSRDSVQGEDTVQRVTWADRVRRTPTSRPPLVQSVRKRYFGKLDHLATRLSNL